MSRHTVPLFRVLLFLLLVAAAPVGAQDCNSNGTDDATDIAVGTSYDCNLNGIPDECDIANSIDPDSTDPVISGVPANISQTNDAGNCSASVTWTEPTATDNCQIQNFISTHSPGATFQVGTTTVTYVATDVHGNSATATFTVTVTDDEGPVINLPATHEIDTSDGVCTGVANWTAPTITDNCAAGLTSTSTHSPGDVLSEGITTVVYTATDGAGNVTNATMYVLVIDRANPTMTSLADISQNTDAGVCSAVVTYTPPTVTNTCHDTALLTAHPSGTKFAPGKEIITFRGFDPYGAAPDGVLLNDTSGGLPGAPTAAGGYRSSGVALGDLDGDGDIDAFLAQDLGEPNRVLLGQNDGTFVDSGQALGSSSSTAVALADFDGDGDLDAFVTNQGVIDPQSEVTNGTSAGAANRVWLNDGTGTFTDSGQTLGSSLSVDVEVGDLDGDGDIDAAVANGGTISSYLGSTFSSQVWLNDGAGTFTSGAALGAATSIALHDYDGDGDLDYFQGQFGSASILQLNDGSGGAGTSTSLNADGNGPLGSYYVNDLVPFSAGGEQYVALATGFGDASYVVQLTSSGGLLDQTLAATLTGLGQARSIAAGDMDGDGDLDLFVGQDFGGANILFLNDGTNTAWTSGTSTHFGNTADVALATIDNDAFLDVFVANDLSVRSRSWTFDELQALQIYCPATDSATPTGWSAGYAGTPFNSRHFSHINFDCQQMSDDFAAWSSSYPCPEESSGCPAGTGTNKNNDDDGLGSLTRFGNFGDHWLAPFSSTTAGVGAFLLVSPEVYGLGDGDGTTSGHGPGSTVTHSFIIQRNSTSETTAEYGIFADTYESLLGTDGPADRIRCTATATNENSGLMTIEVRLSDGSWETAASNVDVTDWVKIDYTLIYAPDTTPYDPTQEKLLITVNEGTPHVASSTFNQGRTNTSQDPYRFGSRFMIKDAGENAFRIDDIYVTTTHGAPANHGLTRVDITDNEAPVIQDDFPSIIELEIGNRTGCSFEHTLVLPAFSDNCYVDDLILTMQRVDQGTTVTPGHGTAGGSIAEYAVATTTHEIDGKSYTASLTCPEPVTLTNHKDHVFYLTATDCYGNTTGYQWTIRTSDTISPILNDRDTDRTVNSTSNQCQSANLTILHPSLTDNCPASLQATLSGANTDTINAAAGGGGSFNYQFNVGTTTVTWTATDQGGNTDTTSITVTVADIQNPTISNTPDNITQTADPGNCSAVVTWTPPTGADNCSQVLTSTHAPGDTFVVGTTTVTYTSTDPAGNTATSSFTVTVTDDESPTISNTPANITQVNDAGNCSAVVTWTPPTGADNCSQTLTSTHAPGDTFSVGTTTVTYTSTDPAGLTATTTFDVTVTDNENPVISNTPADITQTNDAGNCSAAVTWTEPTAADNCAVATLVSDFAPGSTFSVGTTTVTYTATDDAGNSATSTFTVTVTDNESPTINSVPTDITVNNATGTCAAVANWAAPTAFDNCTVISSLTSDYSSGDSFPVGTTTVTYTAVDQYANSATATFTVTVLDIEDPVISNVPANISQSNDAGNCTAVVTWTPPTANDNCSQTLTSTHAPGDTFSYGLTTVTYTSTDPAGNTDTESFTVTVTDDEAPTFTGTPADITQSAGAGGCSATVTWTPPTAADNCGTVTSLTSDHAPGDTFPVGATTVTYTAVDPDFNSSTTSFTVTVTDNEDPVITGIPSDITLTAEVGQCSRSGVGWTPPTALDNCSATLTTTHAPGSTFNVGTTTVTYTATDPSSNTVTASFTVTITDTQDPTISGTPADITQTNDAGNCSAVVTWTAPTAADNCSAALTSTHAPGDTFSVGTTTVTYTATDPSGNSVTSDFTVTVTDDEDPVISSMPANITLTADPGACNRAGVTWSAPSASDNCTVISSLTSDHSPGDTFPVGTTTVTYTAVDQYANSTTATFTVTITDDENPTISNMPADITLTADAGACSRAAVGWTRPSASDNCTVTLTSSHSPGGTFPVGATVVTYTATDGSSNTTTATFTVTITDDENPVITGALPDITQSVDPGFCSAVVTWTAPTASDNCGVTLTSTHAPGDTFITGTTTVTYTATDPSSNTVTRSFTVTVFDGNAPTISGMPADITQTNDAGNCTAAVTWTAPTATDDCGLDTLTSDYSPGATFPVGATTVTYTATDTGGNTSTATFTVTVTDDENPTVVGTPADISQTNDAGNCTAIVTWTAPTPADNCSATLASSHDPGDTFPVGVTTVTFTATDPAGNTGTSTFNITVTDDEDPTISSVPADITQTNDAGNCSAVITWTPPTGADNCSQTLTSTHAPGDTFSVGTTPVTYTSTDPAGNTATATFNVTITDDEAPVISGTPADITQTNDAGNCSAVVTWTPPTAADNCGTVSSLTPDLPPGSTFNVGTTTVTYTAVDPDGNISTSSFTVTVTDDENPTVVGTPADISQTNDAGNCSAVVTWTPPTPADNCSATLASSHAPGDTFPVGTTTVTYTATDPAGNTGTSTLNITVTDDENPTISGVPADITQTNDAGNCSAVITWTPPTAADNCSQTLTSTHAPGDTFIVGTTTVTYTSTDPAGNTATASFTVTVTDDEVPSFSNVPADITLTADAGLCSRANVTWTPPTPADNCTTISSFTSDHSPGETFPVGLTVVTYTAVDQYANTNTVNFNITITDDENPVISGTPADSTQTADPGLCNTAVTWTAPTATDNCSVTLTSSHAPGDTFTVGVTTVTYTATDPSSNSVTSSFTVTVTDDEDPVISNMPVNLFVNNDTNACGAVVSWLEPTATDNCSVVLTSNPSPGDFFPVGTTTVTYTAVDPSSNTVNRTFTITVTDTADPVIAGTPANITQTADAGNCSAVVTWTPPTATDNCSVDTLVGSHAPGDTFPVGTTTVTYTATDVNTNTSSTTFTITVTDDEDPTISGTPADITQTNDAGVCSAVVTWTAPTAADNCSVVLTSTHAPGDTFPVGVTTVTYTATDPAANTVSTNFTITVTDAGPPTISGTPADITQGTDAGNCTAVVTWTAPTASDDCSLASFTSDRNPGDIFPLGTTTVTYTATDSVGLTTTSTFDITVEDTESPTITSVPADITQSNDAGNCSAVVTWTAPTGNDNCSQTLTSSHAPGDTFSVGATTVTYTSTDPAGNIGTATFTVTVTDDEGPTISGMPTDITLTADAGLCSRAAVTWTEPTAADNCTTVSSFTSDHASGDTFPVGVTVVTYTAVDQYANSTSATFNITITDDELPVISGVPADITLTADPGQCTRASVGWTVPTATDNCGVTLTASHTPGDTFPVGVTTVTFTAVDPSSNTTVETFLVTITDDENPTITGLPGDFSLTADPGQCSRASVGWARPSAQDNCSVTLTSTHSPGDTFPVGPTTVTYTATDASSNVVTASFVVTITDDEDPVITGTPADITQTNDGGACNAVVTWTPPTATDNCSQTLTSTHAPGDTFTAGTTVVTYTSTDPSGNTVSTSFNVTITDDQDPTISGTPADITQTADAGNCTAVVTWTAPTAADNCAISTFTSSHAPGDAFPVGLTTVTYTATDTSSNTTSTSFTITVTDDEDPTITGTPVDFSQTADAGNCNAVVTWTAPTAADNCSVVLTSTHAPGDTFPVGVTSVTYTATDPSSNVVTTTFSITVTDDELPVIAGTPADITQTADPGVCNAVVSWTAPTATDNCGVTLTSSHSPGDSFPVGSTLVTYTAVDPSANTATTTFTVTVTDDELPVISGTPADSTQTADPGLCNTAVTWTPPAVTDNCNQTLTSTHAPGDTFSVGVTTVTYTSVDPAGNTSTASFTVTVTDDEAPVISGTPADISQTNDLNNCSAVVTWTPPTGADNCGSQTLTSTHAPGDTFPVGSTTVTYTSTDPSGNSATTNFVITVTDDQGPVLVDMPITILVNNDAGLCGAVVSWTEPTLSDNCSNPVLTSTSSPGDFFPVGTTTITYTGTDASGNTTTDSFDLTVTDTSDPVINGLSVDLTVNNDQGVCGAAVTWVAPTASDNCGVASLTSDHAPGDLFPIGPTTVTYTATDDNGRTSTDSFTITVVDNEDPVVSGTPSDITQSTDAGVCNAVVTWTAPTATDNCSQTLTSSHAPGDTFSTGTTTVTYTSVDPAGNTVTTSFTVTVNDNENPTISGNPGNLTQTADAGNCTAVVTWAAPTAADNCAIASFTSSHTPGAAFPVGTTTVTYTATDTSSNVTTATFTILVTDDEDPTISGTPADITQSTDAGNCTAVVTWTAPTAADNCSVTLTSSHAPGDAFGVGLTTVTYTATDASSNVVTTTFSVTVTDDELPVIAGTPADIAQNTDAGACNAVVTWTPPTATDNCGVTLTSSHAPGDTFPVGATTVTYTAVDPSSNTATSTFTVTITDNELPVISGTPSDITQTADAGLCNTAVTWTAPTVADNCPAPTLTADAAPGDTFPVGTTLVTYTATDANGNIATTSFNVIVTDDELPVISGTPADITQSKDFGGCDAVVTWTAPTAADNCGIQTFVGDASPGDTFPVGATVVTYTATDVNGNVATSSFTIQITDDEPPVITGMPADITQTNDAGVCGASVTWNPPSASDDCAIDTFVSTHSPGDLFPVGATIVTYTATDTAGSSTSASFTITVTDDEDPVIVGTPASFSQTNDLGACEAVVTWTPPTATDNCSVSLTSTHAPGDTFPVGDTVVTYTAVDPATNTVTTNFTITVTDDESPVISGTPADISQTNDAGSCFAVVTWTPPTATDNCGQTLTGSHSPGDTFLVGTTTVTYTSVDGAGNSVSSSFTITVTDDEDPVITGTPADITQDPDAGLCTGVVTWTPPTATDNCSQTLTSTHAPGDTFPVGPTTVTYTSTDPAGNSVTSSFVVTITDSEDPTISGMPADITQLADGGSCFSTVTWTDPTTSDNCGATLSSTASPGDTFPLGPTVVTYTSTDAAGNTATASFTITVSDGEDPVISGVPSSFSQNNDPGLCTATVTWTEPTASDNCGVTLTSTASPGDAFAVGPNTVTYTATDPSGNSATASFVITVIDNELPVISGTPASIQQSNDLGECSAVVSWTAPTATDNCTLVSLTPSHPPGGVFPVGSTTVTYTATDDSGNTSTSSFVVTVTDDESPLFLSMPADITQTNDAGLCGATVTWVTPTSADNCVLNSFGSDYLRGEFFPVGTTVVTYTAVDIFGNSASASFNVTVLDAEAPTISGTPAAIAQSTDAGVCTAVVTWSEPTAADNCGVTSYTSTANPGDTFALGTTTVTYTALDAAGGTAITSFDITISDAEAPTISGMPADITQSNDAGLCSAVVSWAAPSAADNCGIASFTPDTASGSTFAVGTSTVTYTATDDAGNTTTASFTVTVTDDEAPVISDMPSAITTTTEPGICGATVTWAPAMAVDNCVLNSFTSDYLRGDFFPEGTTTVTYTALDTAGNSSTASFTVTVVDNENPTIADMPANITRTSDAGACGAIVTWAAPTGVDNCSVSTITSDHASGDLFPFGPTTVTYTVTDGTGNTATASFSITVTDDEAPVINGLADIAQSTDAGACSAVVSWTAPTAADNCGVASLTGDATSGDTFTVGTTTVTYTATDIHGNSATGTFTITVTDTEVPTISGVPADMTIPTDAGVCVATASWTAPTAADNCGIASLVPDVASGTQLPVGTTTVTYTATDTHGNTATAAFTVLVFEPEAPILSGIPADITSTSDTGVCGAVITWTEPTATDNCGVDSITSDAASGDTFPVGVTTVTYTVTDLAGNSVSDSFTVTITDGEAPVISGTPADITIGTDAGVCTAVVTWSEPTVSDNCVGTMTSDHTTGDTFPLGVTTVTYTAVDAAGNTTTSAFTITVADDEAPTISGVPADMTLTTDAGSCGAVAGWTAPTTADNCSATITGDAASGDTFPLGTTTVTYTATDAAGNTATASFTITVTDGETPTISGMPADISLSNDAGLCAAVATWTAPTAADNCAVTSLTADHASGDSFPVGTTTVTYTATDAAGNATTASFDITISDTESPTITGVPSDMTLPAEAGLCQAVASWTAPIFSDNCALVATSSDTASGSAFPVGTTVVTFSATDLHGNVATASFSITVVDQELPVISDMPADITVNADPGTCAATVTWTEPLITDNCGAPTIVPGVTSGSSLGVGTHPVTYFVVDAAGNFSIATFTITVLDGEPPSPLSGLPADITEVIPSGDCSGVVTWTEPTSTDLCSAVTISADLPSGSAFPLGTTTVTYTAADASGNQVTGSFEVTVTDQTGPTFINTPADITVTADPGSCAAVVTWTEPTASDPCGVVSESGSHASGATFPVGTTTVTYSAVDPGGSVGEVSFTITVNDTDAPTISGMPADITVDADPITCGGTATWTEPTAADDCALDSLVGSATSGDLFGVGTTTVTYTATDSSGNVATASFTVTVNDITDPAIDGMPTDVTVTATPGACSATVTWTEPTATDVCGIASLAGDAASGGTFPLGTTVVTYTATDGSGNTASSSFSVTVLDGLAPTISGMPADVTVGVDAGTCHSVVSWTEPTATDDCSTPTLTSTHSSGSAFTLGTTVITYTATDASGNTATASFEVTVFDDEFPTLTGLPTALSANASSTTCSTNVSWPDPVASDNCGTVNYLTTHEPGSLFPVGTTLVVYTVSDGSGNSDSVTFTVTVVDIAPPTISGLPGTLEVDADPSLCGAFATWTSPTILDNCAVSSSTSTHVSGSFFPLGTTVVTYTAQDIHGNVGAATFQVVVSDTVAPELTAMPLDISVGTDLGQCTASVTWTEPVATDACSAATLTSSHAPGSTFPAGTTTVTYTATDTSGNSTSASFTVTVTDNELPSITVGADISGTPNPGDCFLLVAVPAPSFVDNCPGATVTNDLTGTADASGEYPYGTTTITWTVTDASGNSASGTQQVIVGSGSFNDCNGNGIADECDLLDGTELDCDENGVPDSCDIASGTAVDANQDGLIDACDANFVRCDSNDDQTLDVADPVYTLNYLFQGGPTPNCQDAGDCNDDGLLDISDVIFTLAYIFSTGNPPPAPYPDCGVDGTPGDALQCVGSSSCP